MEDINLTTLVQHYCDLNNIPYHLSRDEVITQIEQNPQQIFHYHTPYYWLFNHIQQYANKIISLEEFMSAGDQNNPVSKPQDHHILGDNDIMVQDTHIPLTRPYNNIITIS